jgi:2-dehydro-3-deoxygluconokinase
MKAREVTFGEIILRLKSPGSERLLQSSVFGATFGGGGANVALSLAQLGIEAAFATTLPAKAIADVCIARLRGLGVDTSSVVWSGDRMGIYFLGAGADQCPSKVVCDSSYSAISAAGPKTFDWKNTFEDPS